MSKSAFNGPFDWTKQLADPAAKKLVFTSFGIDEFIICKLLDHLFKGQANIFANVSEVVFVFPINRIWNRGLIDLSPFADRVSLQGVMWDLGSGSGFFHSKLSLSIDAKGKLLKAVISSSNLTFSHYSNKNEQKSLDSFSMIDLAESKLNLSNLGSIGSTLAKQVKSRGKFSLLFIRSEILAFVENSGRFNVISLKGKEKLREFLREKFPAKGIKTVYSPFFSYSAVSATFGGKDKLKFRTFINKTGAEEFHHYKVLVSEEGLLIGSLNFTNTGLSANNHETVLIVPGEGLDESLLSNLLKVKPTEREDAEQDTEGGDAPELTPCRNVRAVELCDRSNEREILFSVKKGTKLPGSFYLCFKRDSSESFRFARVTRGRETLLSLSGGTYGALPMEDFQASFVNNLKSGYSVGRLIKKSTDKHDIIFIFNLGLSWRLLSNLRTVEQKTPITEGDRTGKSQSMGVLTSPDFRMFRNSLLRSQSEGIRPKPVGIAKFWLKKNRMDILEEHQDWILQEFQLGKGNEK